MIKFAAGKDDGTNKVTFVGMGLSYENIEQLKKGRPIKFDGKEVDLPGIEFMVFADETEDKILEAFKNNGWISPKTKFNDYREKKEENHVYPDA